MKPVQIHSAEMVITDKDGTETVIPIEGPFFVLEYPEDLPKLKLLAKEMASQTAAALTKGKEGSS